MLLPTTTFSVEADATIIPSSKFSSSESGVSVGSAVSSGVSVGSAVSSTFSSIPSTVTLISLEPTVSIDSLSTAIALNVYSPFSLISNTHVF